ncbi:TetR/AcrR family transcriptional regulator [Dyadobacter psychrotolerans]|uniref:TetR/AcrR family transcriptional regulator n=1 Tax=Dyadobacter psychrotolerans TaxID=2541721 RepID=A0A4R5DKD4_9BACT|nr:TetR/AcrR family transcriptional regulator [Dyadobacter psychrotolerans]TDE11305.1 TetR/AcrR family transcriptional regulator [Dyadobacter psychrotolerans]
MIAESEKVHDICFVQTGIIVKCINLSSEEKLKEAAKTVFLKKGFAGTTARDIADAAGMNIALTNYYFRSKEKLFVEIFRDLFELYCTNTIKILDRPVELKEKIIAIIEEDYRMMKEEPSLVLFIMTEIHRDCENLLPELSKYKELLKGKLVGHIQEAVQKGIIRNIEVEHLMPIIIGSLQFIFVGKNMHMKMHSMSEAQFDKYTETHKNHVIGMVTNYLFTDLNLN